MWLTSVCECAGGSNSLVVVIDRNRELFLGTVLPNYVFVQERLDFLGCRKLERLGRLGDLLTQLLFDDLVAKLNALIADVDRWSSNQFANLLLALAAEGALQQVTCLTQSHEKSLYLPLSEALRSSRSV